MKNKYLLFIFCWLLTAAVHAQPPPPPPPGPLGGPGTDVPFDNDVLVLLFAAAGFGAYKLKKDSLKTFTVTDN